MNLVMTFAVIIKHSINVFYWEQNNFFVDRGAFGLKLKFSIKTTYWSIYPISIYLVQVFLEVPVVLG